MTLFEMSFLGPEFTFVRFVVSVPLVIVVSELLGAWLERRGYELAPIVSTPATCEGRR